MSLTPRIFFLDDQGDLVRIPLARWERLHHERSTERMPEWAGKRVKALHVVVELVNRRPVAVRDASGVMVVFDEDGRLDQDTWSDQLRLAVEALPGLGNPMTDHRVRFHAKRYRDTYRWEPSPMLVAEVTRVTLG